MSLKLKIVTPRGVYFEGDVDYLDVRSSAGQLRILPHHTPLITPLEISKLSFKKDDEVQDFAIGGGILLVDELTTILLNSIEAKKDIDLQRALNSKKRAEERLLHSDEVDISRAKASLSRALNRINVCNN